MPDDGPKPVGKVVGLDMIPGPQLDAIVGEKVMGLVWDESRCRVCGWKIVPDGEQGCWRDHCSLRPPPSRRADDFPLYSTDIAAAWTVVERLSFPTDRCYFALSNDPDGMWVAEFGARFASPRVRSPAHAICLAALAYRAK